MPRPRVTTHIVFKADEEDLTSNCDTEQYLHLQCHKCNEILCHKLTGRDVSLTAELDFLKKKITKFRDRLNTLLHLAETNDPKLKKEAERLRREIMGDD